MTISAKPFTKEQRDYLVICMRVNVSFDAELAMPCIDEDAAIDDFLDEFDSISLIDAWNYIDANRDQLMDDVQAVIDDWEARKQDVRLTIDAICH